MTAIRQSFVFQLEDKFGAGKMSTLGWLAPPPGSFFDSTDNRQTTTLYGSGDKFRQNVAYGQFAGSWNWTFPLDYHYLEPLMLAFESVNDKVFSKRSDRETFGSLVNNKFVFKKVNTRRVPSFCVRRKISNKMVSPDSLDELDELLGCFVQQVSFSRSNATSQWQVNLSGVFADKTTVLGELPTLDYAEYDTDLVEYACLFQGDGVVDDNYVAYTQAISMAVNNNGAAEFNTCSPFAVIYHEGKAQFQFSTTMYAADPLKWKMRTYSGGIDNTHRRPMAKNLRPMDTITIAAYNESITDNPAIHTMAQAFNASDTSLKLTIKDAVLKTMKYPNGDGSKLVDSVSSVDCSSMELEIKPHVTGYNLLTTNVIASTDMVEESYDYEIPVGSDTVGIDMDYAAPVVAYLKLIKDTAVTSSDSETLMNYTKGFSYIPGSTVCDATAVSGTDMPLSSILVRPLAAVTGINISNGTVPNDDIPYITIAGTPTAVETGYYFIVNAVTGSKGVLRIDVRPSS